MQQTEIEIDFGDRLTNDFEIQIGFMNPKEFAEMEQLDTATLVTISAERDASHRKHAASHILELRRAEPLKRAATASAHAAIWAAVAAFISAAAAVITLFRH